MLKRSRLYYYNTITFVNLGTFHRPISPKALSSRVCRDGQSTISSGELRHWVHGLDGSMEPQNAFFSKKSLKAKKPSGRVQNGRIFPPFGRFFPPFGRVRGKNPESQTKKRLFLKKRYQAILSIHGFINQLSRQKRPPFLWDGQPLASPQIANHVYKVALTPQIAPLILLVQFCQWCCEVNLLAVCDTLIMVSQIHLVSSPIFFIFFTQVISMVPHFNSLTQLTAEWRWVWGPFLGEHS